MVECNMMWCPLAHLLDVVVKDLVVVEVEILCPGGWIAVVVDGWKIDLDSAVECGGLMSGPDGVVGAVGAVGVLVGDTEVVADVVVDPVAAGVDVGVEEEEPGVEEEELVDMDGICVEEVQQEELVVGIECGAWCCGVGK